MKQKKPVGAPRIFETPKQFEKAVNKYFAGISRMVPVTEIVTEGGVEITIPVKNMLGKQIEIKQYVQKPSVQGLCCELGISRDTWCEYAKREGYAAICQAAKLEMERDRVDRLGQGKGDHGIEFDLKYNFGWKDSITIDAGENVQKAIERKPVSMDEQLELLRKLGLKLPGEET